MERTHRILKIDEHVIELKNYKHLGHKVYLNRHRIIPNVERRKADERFEKIKKGLEETGYSHKEYISERDEEEKAESEAKYALIREYRDGSLDQLEFSDNRGELVNMLKQD